MDDLPDQTSLSMYQNIVFQTFLLHILMHEPHCYLSLRLKNQCVPSAVVFLFPMAKSAVHILPLPERPKSTPVVNVNRPTHFRKVFFPIPIDSHKNLPIHQHFYSHMQNQLYLLSYSLLLFQPFDLTPVPLIFFISANPLPVGNPLTVL